MSTWCLLLLKMFLLLLWLLCGCFLLLGRWDMEHAWKETRKHVEIDQNVWKETLNHLKRDTEISEKTCEIVLKAIYVHTHTQPHIYIHTYAHTGVYFLSAMSKEMGKICRRKPEPYDPNNCNSHCNAHCNAHCKAHCNTHCNTHCNAHCNYTNLNPTP